MKKIKLTQGKYALVDDKDFEFLSQFKWYAFKTGTCWYALRNIGTPQKKLLMHRVIMTTPEGMEIDHIDRDGLNNQRSNLRVATRSQNQGNKGKQVNNTSGYKGVSWHKAHKKWRAMIGVNGDFIYLGSFTSKELAYQVYCKAAQDYRGEFATVA